MELDENKRQALLDYIFKNRTDGTQLIVSTLGFDIKDYPKVDIKK